jgi:hypothetical protein
MNREATTSTARDERPRRARLAPPLELFLFLIFPVASLVYPNVPIRDPGVGWHLVLGRQILETWRIPTADAFSFTATGTEWVSFYWLFQVMAAFLERIGGLPLFTAASILVNATVPVLLYRRMVRMGVGSLMALLLAVLAYHVLLAHALARPHAFTYVFFALLLDQLDRFQTGNAAARSLAWLPLLALVWCNIHGGFVVGLVLTGLYAAVAGVRFLLNGDAAEKHRCRVFMILLAAMSAATLVNPAGPWLHLSIVDYLGMESTSHFSEWHSPNFGTDVRSLAILGLILGFVILLATRSRISWIEAVLLTFFLESGLRSERHINLYAIVAVPILGRELLQAIKRSHPSWGQVLSRVKEPPPTWSSTLLWYTPLCLGFLILAAAGQLTYRTSLEDVRLSGDAAAYIEAHLPQFDRPFNSDDLGGSLIYLFWPEVHVFMDDRNPVYGDEFVLDQYEVVAYAKPGWDAVLDRWGIRTAVVRTGTAVATLLKASPNWASVHEDETTVLFERIGPLPDATAPAGRRDAIDKALPGEATFGGGLD